jgi:predicted nucleic acid-binding protein
VTPTVVLLDANVLYPARLRDLLIRLAIAGLYQARWSERILDECFGSLVADRPDLSIAQISRTRELMSVALPEATVSEYEHLIDDVRVPDPNDRHVVAAAVAAHAEVIVTRNIGDFPTQALPAGLLADSPDAFVLSLIAADAEAVAAVVEEQAAALHKPPMTVGELLDGFEEVGLSESVRQLRTLVNA